MPPYTNTTFDSDKGVVFSPNTSSKQAPVKYVSNGNGGLDVAPSEPAVLSSSNISDTVIPQNRAKLEQLSTKGTTVGADGVHLYADGSVVPAPPDAELTDGVYTSGGKNYAAPAQDTGTNDDDPESRQINALLESMRSSLDASTKGQVDAIHTQFQQLRADQMDANTRNEKSRAQSLLLGGSSRYAPLSAASTMLAQTSYGLRQIQDLDAAENTAIANAKKAEQDGDMQLMQTQLQLVEKKREEKQAAAAKIADQLQAANQASAQQRLNVARDEAVANLIAGGVTKASDIMKAMNDAGWELTAKDINGVISDVQPKGSDSDLYKFSNDDVGKLLGAGINAGTIQALSDYYNGRSDGSDLGNLSTGQQAVVQRVLTGKGVGSDTTAFKFTPTQTSQLLSGNFTQKDIVAMQSDIAEHGIDTVVAGMPADQQKLVKRVLGTSDSVGGDISTGDDQFITSDYFEKLFGDDNLKTAASDAGYRHVLTDWDTEKKNYLDSLMNTVEQYRQAGYTDKEILKMMQS